jgi:hypothetical protein
MASQCTILAQAFQMLQAMWNDEYMPVEEIGNMILMACILQVYRELWVHSETLQLAQTVCPVFD